MATFIAAGKTQSDCNNRGLPDSAGIGLSGECYELRDE
jgi:hypothetical protein